ncbi:hypothetical protein QWJ34_11470 [Saccharibacillus sp. CPCC 101409]|uniref:alpha/beta hydrolase family protein n=1 Tax=Saccharibacillus sp. CPCC 101409 TaxID=3058041 RepID=UPI002671B5CC|nr:hypothetical protein [Saccharibacillus sp. CPCC 101409]MDO3410383.1 hypothetical protein [Saccharibacillus sp. CPCC 101409]
METAGPALPLPGGVYAVGFYDGSLMCEEPDGSQTEIGFRCFYPAAEPSGEPALYYPQREMLDMQLELPLYEPFAAMLEGLLSLPTHSFEGAKPPETEEKFPVVVYSHGYTTFAWSNLIQFEELASRGYVVFALSHPGDAFWAPTREGRPIGVNQATVKAAEDDYARFAQTVNVTDPDALTLEEIAAFLRASVTIGERVEAWTRHTIAAFDEIERIAGDPESPLAGRLDVSGYGLFGHSLGGAASLNTALFDERVRAAVNLDGWQYGFNLAERAIPVPGLVMATSARHLPANYLPGDPNLAYAIVPGGTHWFFCDFAVLAGDALRASDPSIGIDGNTMSRLTGDMLLAFFDRHLRGDSQASIEKSAAGYAEYIKLQLHG